jgi:hypothetical protein
MRLTELGSGHPKTMLLNRRLVIMEILGYSARWYDEKFAGEKWNDLRHFPQGQDDN